jgi:hypothetical protein
VISVFEKTEYRMFGGVNAETFFPGLQDFWIKEGFSTVRVSPYRILGESFDSRIGLKRNFALTVYEQAGVTYMDLQLQAKVTDFGMVGGAAAAFICLPIAVVAGAISYHEYDKDAKELNRRFWDYMGLVSRSMGAPNN